MHKLLHTMTKPPHATTKTPQIMTKGQHITKVPHIVTKAPHAWQKQIMSNVLCNKEGTAYYQKSRACITKGTTYDEWGWRNIVFACYKYEWNSILRGLVLDTTYMATMTSCKTKNWHRWLIRWIYICSITIRWNVQKQMIRKSLTNLTSKVRSVWTLR